MRANTISFTVFPEIGPSIGNSFINTMKNINHTRSSFFFFMIRRPPRSTLFPYHDALPIWCRASEIARRTQRGIGSVNLSNDPSANGWRWGTLEKIAVEGAPILYGILQPGPDLADGIPYVRPTEIVEDIIDLTSIRRTSPTIAAKYKRSVLKPNDIILSIVGTIGKVALVPPDLDGGNITQSSVRIRVRPEIALSRYIAWALRSRSEEHTSELQS